MTWSDRLISNFKWRPAFWFFSDFFVIWYVNQATLVRLKNTYTRKEKANNELTNKQTNERTNKQPIKKTNEQTVKQTNS